MFISKAAAPYADRTSCLQRRWGCRSAGLWKSTCNTTELEMSATIVMITETFWKLSALTSSGLSAGLGSKDVITGSPIQWLINFSVEKLGSSLDQNSCLPGGDWKIPASNWEAGRFLFLVRPSKIECCVCRIPRHNFDAATSSIEVHPHTRARTHARTHTQMTEENKISTVR